MNRFFITKNKQNRQKKEKGNKETESKKGSVKSVHNYKYD